MAIGRKTGGRVKGSLNKINRSVADMLAARGCNPFETLADISEGSLMCSDCRRAGVTPVRGKKPHLRECQSCKGDGWEKISPAERERASSTLCKYVKPQLQAMQVSGPEGEPIAIRVIFGKE